MCEGPCCVAGVVKDSGFHEPWSDEVCLCRGCDGCCAFCLNCEACRCSCMDGKYGCFFMQMLYVCVLCATCGIPQCCVLHDL